MKLAAAFVAAATLLLPAAGAAKNEPVLGIDWNGQHSRLAWFDPATLATLPGPKPLLGKFTGSWSFSPDRSVLAIGSSNAPELRFVDVRHMRVLGNLRLARFGAGDYVTWLTPSRLLAINHNDPNELIVVDPQRRRVLRRVTLPPVWQAARLPFGLALLYGSSETGFSPAAVAVADANGNARTVTVDRIPIGTVVKDEQTHSADMQRPGFAVDPWGHHAYLVGPDFLVAEIDLGTLLVTYHSESRTLAAHRKMISGPYRTARWLGNGMLAVSGTDHDGNEIGTAVGLRLIDTHDWSSRMVDPELGSVSEADGLLVGATPWSNDGQHYAVYDFYGALRYKLDVPSGLNLSVQGPFAYVCRGLGLMRVLDTASGATLREVQGDPLPTCAALLHGWNSQF